MEAGDLEKPRRVVSRSSSRGSAIGGTGMRTLEKKNKALNNATKELEEKVKNLRERTVHRSLPKVRIRTPEKTLCLTSSGKERTDCAGEYVGMYYCISWILG